MKSKRAKLATWGVAATLVAALAVGCGGGGGGSGSPTGRINGALSKSGTVQTASLSLGRRLLASAGSWLGIGRAFADGTTECGNAADPAAGVTVDLLLNGVVQQSTVTGSDGEFTFSNLSPGNYVIQVSLPSGVISAPAIVQPGQVTTLDGELDLDCNDVDADDDTTEVALHVEQETEDGSQLDADETEDGGHFEGEVKDDDGSTITQQGAQGDRSDEHDTDSDGGNGSD